jgi:actin-like ATPase involved in cell morphogenesis
MKKENLIEQLTAAKALSSQVDIDKVIELINQITSETKLGITQEIAEEIARKFENALDRDSDELVDLDSAEFELNYDNRIELSRVDVNTSSIRGYIEDILEEFIIEEDEVSENEDSTEEAAN